ncbi:MAG: MgtC/SapB family protein [Spirochaetaceae bacterium]|jgi:putative Mg2+ transporter-C (MgtC) family protein|nr:MgtC/SapB family protein [Spirochaetaceae bacterium]
MPDFTSYDTILTSLHELNFFSLIIRSFLAVLLGGILGFERSKNHRPAGFRTHMLVCFGAALVMMTNQFVWQTYHVSDPVRLGAQVISGIGFLGAGSIILNGRNQVRGITTAAGLWAAACCGLAIGIGFYSGAIAAGFVIYGIMAVMRRIDDQILKGSNIVTIYLELDRDHPFSGFLFYARENDLTVSDIQLSKNKYLEKNTFCATLTVKSTIRRTNKEVLELIRCAQGIQFIEVI